MDNWYQNIDVESLPTDCCAFQPYGLGLNTIIWTPKENGVVVVVARIKLLYLPKGFISRINLELTCGFYFKKEWIQAIFDLPSTETNDSQKVQSMGYIAGEGYFQNF